jgi:hypothetical protein
MKQLIALGTLLFTFNAAAVTFTCLTDRSAT